MMENDGKNGEQMSRNLHAMVLISWHPFSLEDLDDSVMEHLPMLKTHQTRWGTWSAIQVIFGTSSSRWLSQQPNWSEIVNPFETFVEETIEECVGPDAFIFWTHETKQVYCPSSKDAPIKRDWHISVQVSLISIHFGPWFALRAVVIVSGHTDCNLEVSNPSSEAIEIQSAALFNRLLNSNATWQEWLSLRDLYDVGRKYRYSEPQIQYHYTHDQMVLLNEVERLQSS